MGVIKTSFTLVNRVDDLRLIRAGNNTRKAPLLQRWGPTEEAVSKTHEDRLQAGYCPPNVGNSNVAAFY